MIRKIRSFLKDKKELVQCFFIHSIYMCPGSYVYNDSLTCLVTEDDDTRNRTNELLTSLTHRKFAYRLCLFFLRKTFYKRKIIVGENDTPLLDFSGTVYLPVGSANGYRDKKIFDFKHDKVLSIFHHPLAYQLVLSNYEYFKDDFSLPTIFWKDDEKRLIMEELVSYKSKNTWETEDYLFVILKVFDDYYRYLSKCKQMGKVTFTSLPEFIRTLPSHSEVQFISNRINPNLMNLSIPKVKLHGDLWTANTLVSTSKLNQIKYIDWEFSNEFLFFYDFFNLMWIEVFMNNQLFYFDQYTKGGFDTQFTKIFSLFDLPFNQQNRMDYFNMYFLNFFSIRMIEFNEADQQTYLNQYKRILAMYT